VGERSEDPLERPTVDGRRKTDAAAATDAATAPTGGVDATADTAMSAPDSMSSLLRALVATPGGGAAAPLAAGTVVDDQYRIAGRIGHGGMGVVYRAHDLRLDRDVALKLSRALSPDALRRLEREAVALARLSHPNVVVVHQVGETEGRVYLAMELVEGGNAREWLAARPRTWREIVALYAGAGTGLAAAHAAGFVHRDFKPDNVLVGADGRPRVADFGLALGAAAAGLDPGTPPGGARGTAPPSAELVRLTQTGTMLGTPAYMAPEQLAGDPVDARADQYAFCAALWEALFGQRPFDGPTPDAVRQAIESSEPAGGDGRATHGAPRHLVAALRRGLRADPAERWPSMDALLIDLRRDPAARRRRIALVAGTVVVVAAATAGALELTAGAAPCTDGPARIATAWSPARADAIARHFAAIGGAAMWPEVRARLDGYTRAWAIAHRDACRATRVDGSQGEAMLDLRMTCLARARAQVDEVAGALGRLSHDEITAVHTALAQLPDLAGCANTDVLGHQVPVPADPATRTRLDQAIRAVARARTIGLGLSAVDASAGEKALAAARAAGWAPEIADATRINARLVELTRSAAAARPGFHEAARLALESGADETAAWSMADLAWNLANADKGGEAATWIELSRAYWVRLGRPPDLGVRVYGAESMRAFDAGEPDAGLAATRERVRLARIAYQGDVPEAINHYDLAQALTEVGKFDDAATEITAAIDLDTEAEGAAGPHLIHFLGAAARIETRRGHLADAVALDRRAVAIAESWFGDDDLRLAGALERLGAVLFMAGDPDDARPPIERALAIRGRADPDSQNVAEDETNLANADAAQGHYPTAIERGRRALATMEKLHGKDNPDLINVLVLLGYSERGLGRLDDSEGHLRRAVDIAVAKLGPKHYNTVNPRIELAHTLLAHGRAAAAAAALAPAIALADADPNVPPPWVAEARLTDADALWRSGGDRARARALAAAARDGYAGLGKPFAAQTRDADAWLAAHGGRPR
jgi:eukaryotic-like serine/threonine-protein kinase